MDTVMMNSSSNNPLVTIITIVFNNVTTISNAIQSVAYQNYDNIEHVVIDNCSNDGTLEAINEHQEEISLINLYFMPCYGAPFFTQKILDVVVLI